MESFPATVADLMTRDVVTLSETDTLENLLESMHQMRFRHTPVTDEGCLVGLLSERDVLRFSASSLLPHAEQQDEFLQRRFMVRDVMNRTVVTVTPETSLAQAGEMMLDRRIDCLVVVNAENTVVGIVTSTDLVKLVVKLAARR